MLALRRRLNSECEHVQGDMRPIRLGRVPGVLEAMERCGFSLVDHFTLPNNA